MRSIGLIFIFLSTSAASAEYRAFQLMLRNVETGDEQIITTTLDHLQYRDYYYLGSSVEVLYQTSWMCWGNTSNHKPICPAPEVTEATGPSTNSLQQTPNPS